MVLLIDRKVVSFFGHRLKRSEWASERTESHPSAGRSAEEVESTFFEHRRDLHAIRATIKLGLHTYIK